MNCPRCKHNTMARGYVVVKRDSCPCGYLMQGKITPIIEGGAALLDFLVTYFIENNVNGKALEAALGRQLERVKEICAQSG